MGEERQQKMRRILPAGERQAMILDAALNEFARYGFEACNVDAIAAKARIGKGTIYRQFPSKIELFAAVVKRGHDRLHERMGDVNHCDCRFEERIQKGLKEFVDFFVANPKYYRVMLVERPDRRPHLARVIAHGEAHIAEAIAEHVREAIAEGELRKLDPQFLALAFLALAKVIIERQLYGRGHSLQNDTRTAAEILKGIHT